VIIAGFNFCSRSIRHVWAFVINFRRRFDMRPLFNIGKKTENFPFHSENPQSDSQVLKNMLSDMEALGLIRFGDPVQDNESAKEAA
jgi:hypothetical protein